MQCKVIVEMLSTIRAELRSSNNNLKWSLQIYSYLYYGMQIGFYGFVMGLTFNILTRYCINILFAQYVSYFCKIIERGNVSTVFNILFCCVVYEVCPLYSASCSPLSYGVNTDNHHCFV